MRRTVEFHETDAAGILHFINVLRYFEIAQTHYLKSVGLVLFDPDMNVRWPVLNAECNFTSPLRFGDEVEIELRIKEIRSKTVTFSFVVVRDPDGAKQQAATGALLAIYATYDSAEKRIKALAITPEMAAMFGKPS